MMTSKVAEQIHCWFVIMTDECDNAYLGYDGPFLTEKEKDEFVAEQEKRLGAENIYVIDVPKVFEIGSDAGEDDDAWLKTPAKYTTDEDGTLVEEQAKPVEDVHDLPYRTMYPIGKLTNYYGPGYEDLAVLREAFRCFVKDLHQGVSAEYVEKVIDNAVQEVVEQRGAKKAEAQKTNQQFVDVMFAAVKANTEVQIHCDKHGEVMAFANSNQNLYCPDCYNAALGKIEDMHFKQLLDKVPKIATLPKDPFTVGDAKSGSFEIMQVRVAKPLAEYLRKCGEEALVYGCSVAEEKRKKTEDAE